MQLALLLGITSVFFFLFYSIDLFFPKYRKAKYVIALSFFIIGTIGWLLVWIKMGGLLTAVFSSYFLLTSVILFVMAILLELYKIYT